MNSSLPFCSWKKAAAQRPRSGLRAFLDPHGNLEQESLLPNLVLQSVLKQGRPKGYHLLLASATL
ncbi:C9orf50 isoform 2 [Pongo abelii]|nr:C9orf50 isoform 2 [Pongo abelii]